MAAWLLNTAVFSLSTFLVTPNLAHCHEERDSYIKINYQSVNTDPLKIRRDQFGIYQIASSDSRQIFLSARCLYEWWQLCWA